MLSVSIIVPVYNVEQFITDCFQSIINQNYTGPMECLFIDDCGTDNSIQILGDLIMAYNGSIDMRLLYHDRNIGLSGARNTGIAASHGDYVFFLDSDDQLYPNSVSSLIRAAVKENMPDVVLGGYQLSIPDHPLNRYRFNYSVLNGQPIIAKAFLDDKLFCMAPNQLVRRDFILNNHLFFKEGIIHEDNLWSFQSFHLAHRVVTIPEATYLYIIREGSTMTASSYEKSLENLVVVYDEILHDVNAGRYNLVGDESMNYLKKLINVKCVDLLLCDYHRSGERKYRLQKLKDVPDSIVQIIKKYWSPQTYTTRMLRFFFLSRCYSLFDIIVVLSMKKKDLLSKVHQLFQTL